MDNRGQTLHDYVAGISVFILTVAIVLGLLPSVVAPFQNGGSGGVDAALSSRIGDRVVSNLSVDGAPNVLDGDELETLMAKNEVDLRDRYGLTQGQYVNLSLQTLNGSRMIAVGGTVQTAGATALGEDTTTSARIVTVDDPDFACEPACRLVIQVW